MVYSYDENKHIFYVADHFSSGKYSFEVCSFDELKSSYDIINSAIPLELEHTRYNQLIKAGYNLSRLKFDLYLQKNVNIYVHLTYYK